MFPDPAGEYQREVMTASLLRELGDNYAAYHEYLTEVFRGTGGEPDPADYQGDLPGYTAAADRVMEILTAEVLLRRCRASRQYGVPLSAPLAPIPIVDGSYRLVSVESPPLQSDMTPQMPWFPVPAPAPASLAMAALRNFEGP